MSKQGLLVCISSPSGGGKTTVCQALLDRREDYIFSVSCTTRSPRGNEIDGKDYHFLSKAEFKKKIQNGELAEYEQVHGHYYGTLKSTVASALEQGKVLLVDIDVKGAITLKQEYEELCLTVFLAPPDEEVLRDRLRNRGTESDESMATRMQRLEMEMHHQDKFDRSIINRTLDDTVREAEAIIEQKRKELTEDMIHGA